MPNWCDNKITIHGPKKYIRKIDKIVNENANGKGLLDYMMPMPKELEDTTSPSSSSSDQPPPTSLYRDPKSHRYWLLLC